MKDMQSQSCTQFSQKQTNDAQNHLMLRAFNTSTSFPDMNLTISNKEDNVRTSHIYTGNAHRIETGAESASKSKA